MIVMVNQNGFSWNTKAKYKAQSSKSVISQFLYIFREQNKDTILALYNFANNVDAW